MTEEQLIRGLKNDNFEALEYVYTSYRSDFIRFARKYALQDDLIVDIFQNAIIALRENGMSGKIDDLKSEVKTYLFGIGKYMIFEEIRNQKKIKTIETELNKDLIDSIEITPLFKNDNTLNKKQKLLRKAVQNMSDKCKEILVLFYYRGFDLEEIMTTLNYSSKDVVKSQKSRCLSALRSMLLNK